ncbi:MAG TPA: hypothetical protein VFG04_19130 [Planctomycetaceae bacterium]|jgi:hypothetical protein|nr:hypothetical protein [Planctomycetaceae bacterium]
MSSARGERKLLFVVSNDYGELSTALDFLAGQRFDAQILIPDRLYRANRLNLRSAWRAYHSVADILALAAAQSPDVVFLFSGYLFVINGLFSLNALRQLVTGLQSGMSAVVTSDPFLGQLFRLEDSTFDHPAKRELIEHFAQLVPLLDNVTHLYRVAPRVGATAGSLSFYNSRVVLDKAELTQWSDKAINAFGLNEELKRWLFILSAEDYAVGVARRGKVAFDELLGRKIAETAQVGRQPVLIAPAACIGAVGRFVSTPTNAQFVDFCDHSTFLSLLYEAECCFYWNLFSHSIIARVMNHLPVLFFDYGHLVHAMPSFLKVGVEHFYAGVEPHRLQADEPLTAEHVALATVEQDRRLEEARLRFAKSPAPEEVVELLVTQTDR